MGRKILIISENINYPYDDGAKRLVTSIYSALREKIEIILVTQDFNDIKGLEARLVKLNKFFLSKELLSLIRACKPPAILYIPEASSTFNSFLRAKVLKTFSQNAKIALLANQHKRHNFIFRTALHLFKPDLLFLFDEEEKKYYVKAKMRIKILPPAIDTVQFCAVDIDIKARLRGQYDLPVDKIIVLHVGHIKTNRNLRSLIDIQQNADMQVIIVGSTTTVVDKALKLFLESKGIIIFEKYFPNIQELYQLSDVYVFPVICKTAAIDLPLSVLEAMACNLPVVATRFGILPQYFSEDGSFKYYDTSQELVDSIKSVAGKISNNSEKVKNFTWSNLADKIIEAFEEI